MKIRFSYGAFDDLTGAMDWYQDEAPGTGVQFLNAVLDVLSQLVEFPASGAPNVGGTRRFGVTRFPYGVIYFVEGDVLVILAVAHAKREPGYWASR